MLAARMALEREDVAAARASSSLGQRREASGN